MSDTFALKDPVVGFLTPRPEPDAIMLWTFKHPNDGPAAVKFGDLIVPCRSVNLEYPPPPSITAWHKGPPDRVTPTVPYVDVTFRLHPDDTGTIYVGSTISGWEPVR